MPPLLKGDAMKKASAVIGAGWGDEGKGRVTSALAYSHDLVVRHNGGSQAAHTVVYEGEKHVFGHFGSGTMQGIPTFLSKYFIVNPIIFMRELKSLEKYKPKVFMHKDALVTIPFDMMLNQLAEKARGDNKHGSCGLGINETVTRSERCEPVRVGELAESMRNNTTGILTTRLALYLKSRAIELGVGAGIDKVMFSDETENIFVQFAKDIEAMFKNVEIVDDTILCIFDNVLFEGAQGLLLDEHHGQFPYVTRSSTGITNVKKILEDFPDVPLTVYYVTRQYSTRHGAGPFPTEIPNEGLYPEWNDSTNGNNEWQGYLRYGTLDVDSLLKHIALDSEEGYDVECKLVITCMDQSSGDYHYTRNGTVHTCKTNKFLDRMLEYFNMDIATTCSPETTGGLEFIRFTDQCPECGAQLRNKTLQEGGGVECPKSDCDYWFCY